MLRFSALFGIFCTNKFGFAFDAGKATTNPS